MIIKRVSDCNIVPHIELSNSDINNMLKHDLYHILERVDKQSQIIDICKQKETP